MTSREAGRRLHLLPTSPAGWWSLGLLGLSLVAFALFFASVAETREGYGLNFVGVASAIAAGVVAVVGLVRRHERSLAVALPVLWAILWASFLAGEFVNPH